MDRKSNFNAISHSADMFFEKLFSHFFSTPRIANPGLLVFLFAMIFFTVTSGVRADLLHRYSFTDGDSTAVDSVSGQDGTLENGAVINNNAVRLDGSNQFVNLPGHLITGFDSMTIEVWFTYSASTDWVRVFDFGDTNPDTNNGRYYIYYTPRTNSGTSSLNISDEDPGYNHTESITHSQPPLSVPVYIACIYDGDQDTISLYVDGQYASSTSVSIPLSSVDNVYSYVGRSLYPDPYLDGSIDEFRIYNHPLSSEDIATNYSLGPDAATASNIATLPQPPNDYTGFSVEGTLSWTEPLDIPDSYTIYISEDPNLSAAQVINLSNGTSCQPDLEPDTAYYWRVDTNYNGVGTFTGLLWQFTTCILGVDSAPAGDWDNDYEVGMTDLLIVAELWLNGTDMLTFSEIANNWLLNEPALIINEFLADNDEAFADPDASIAEYDDWIEIYNRSSVLRDLGGMYLTDDIDNPTKWRIPDGIMVAPYDYIIFWADEQQEQGQTHTNFKLDAAGEEIGLFEADGTTLVDSVYFDEQFENMSYGRFPDNASEWNIFAKATPGRCNCEGYDGAIEKVRFSHERGFYDASFDLTMTCATSGATIYYTTDGSVPVENGTPTAASIEYTNPITISSNTCIRAAAVKTDWLPPRAETHTYIFDADETIKSLQVYSIVADEQKSLYEPDGIMAIVGGTYSGGAWSQGGDPDAYNHPIMRGIEYERPVSLEILDPDTGENIQIDCGIRVQGSDWHRPRYTRGDDWNVDTNKFSFKLFFRGDYGESKLIYPIFPLADTDTFKSIALRGGYNDIDNPFIKDELFRRLHQDMGGVAATGTVVNFYLNGEYKSYFNPCGRLDHDFFRDYYDVDTDWDVITQRAVRNGDNTAWSATLNYFQNTNLSNMTNYVQATEMVDVVDFIDYLIVELYSGNYDWVLNNWTVSRERSPEGKFRFHCWDVELSMVSSYLYTFGFDDLPHWSMLGLNGHNTPLGYLYRGFKANPEFRLLFADRLQKHLFYDGALTQSHVGTRFNELRQQMSMVLPNMDTYALTGWIPQRGSLLLAECENQGLFFSQGPDFQVNGISQHGGYVSSTDTITITETGPSGTIYYTLNGNDPRVSALDAQTSIDMTLIAENASKKVLVPTGPVTSNGTISVEYWSGISGTSVSDLTSNPNYPENPSSSGFLSSFETPTNWADNYGTRIRGYLTPANTGNYTFWIASDDSSQLWLSTDEDPANVSQIAYVNGWTNSREWNKYQEQESDTVSLTADQSYYIEVLQKEGTGGDNLAVSWDGPGFGQEVIDGTFLIPFTESWTTISFDDSGWTSGIGGVGYERTSGYESYIDIDTESEMFETNASCYIRIPFTLNASDLSGLTNLILNIRYDDGFIAYINGTEVQRVNFTGTPEWDSPSSGDHEASATPDSYDISAFIGDLQAGDNILAIHGLNRTSDSSDFLITAELIASKIQSGGIDTNAIEYAGSFQFSQSTELKSRVLLPSGEWSALHEASYGVGPVSENLRINELMYHPQDPNEEFVELINTGSESINLNLVRLTKGVDFMFGPEVLAPDEYILLVRNQASFMNRYPDFTGRIAGEYEGALDDGGEKIRLRDAADNIIQEFSYKDGWYDITDGEGFSLTIRDVYSTDPNTWASKDGWRPSAIVGGSPGYDDTGFLPEPGSVVINEVLAHSHQTAPDWIELHNTTDQTINIGGWFLSDSNADDPNIMKYEIPVGTTIDPNSYYVFEEHSTFGNENAEGVHTVFGLSEGGDSVYLRSGSGGVISGYEESESFGASASNVAFGRYIKSPIDGGVNFVPMSQNTPGEDNAYPMVGPVVITEIMYNTEAVNTGGEYIELHNITNEPVALEDEVSTEISEGVFTTETVQWQFSDGIDFVFAPGTIIPANGYIIIASDPTAFLDYYGTMPSGVAVEGPFDNGTALSNGGERIQIVRPGDQEYGKQRYWIRTERVTYDDSTPWPVSADGDGDALHQKTPDIPGANYSNDVINWHALPPSPGS